jgi:ATP-dependent RNA helicase DeaD
LDSITIDQLGLSEEVLKGVRKLGFEKPTSVQEKVIPILLSKSTDLIALAQTGTGKTAAYGLPIIERIDIDNKNTQALILSPTRELCMQIAKDIKKYSKFIKGMSVQAVYGGADINRQIKALRKGAHIIVATPGRMLDLMYRKKADITAISAVVLDEADEMLNMGFQEDLNHILQDTPADKNTLLFSATMPRAAEKIAKDYMTDPEKITVGKRNAGAANVEHLYYMVQAKDRYLALKRIADMNPDIYGIIFCRTRKETKEIADKLIQDGYNADALHGDLTQAQRDFVMQKFRIKNLQMLVATDVAARGLDVNDLTHVINVDLPDDLEVYTHRSGRTGRAGKAGISINIVHSREKGKIRRIEKLIGKKFERRMVPEGAEICKTQLFHLIDKMQNVEIDHDQIDPFLPAVYEKLNNLDKEELIKNFVALEFNRFLNYYKNAKDINFIEKSRRDFKDRPAGRRKSGKGSSGKGYTRFFINVGGKDKLNSGTLIGLINRYCQDREMEIGKVEVMKTFSFFEVDEFYGDQVLAAFRGAMFDKRPIIVEPAQPKDAQRSEKKESGNRRDDKRKGFNKGSFSKKKRR